MSNLIEKLKSDIDRDYITLYDFVINFSKYNNDNLENVGIFLANIGFDDIFSNKDYNIYIYDMADDYKMYASIFFRVLQNPMPKIIQQIKCGTIDKELTTKIYLKKSELLETFNLPELMGFLMQNKKTDIININDKIITLQTQLDQAHARIAELEKIVGQSDEKELTANSKNSVSKLLYALMMNGDFELDGTKKGNLNDRLVSLTKEKGVPVTENFISNWLEYLNDKYYF